MSRQTINAIELGKYNPSTTLALKMAHIFEISVNDLFRLEDGDWQ
ncbi:MAG: helix-turn-helix domain-containing protein [Petrimonas sp.]|nr:helix-turn-helix domain-containing protein [Petrimonas sp.]